ncbi:MAG: hypothetical protein K9H50_04195 [Aurantimicrobium sp.]|nr:hypothetical protein [Aurantimicrobium sp.]
MNSLSHRRKSVGAHRVPWWLTVILVFLGGRIVSTAILLVYASVQGENPWTAAQPNLFDFSSMWDGRWYNIIAEGGYPATLPYTDDGHVGEAQWAFLPVYPLLVKLVMVVTGLPWAIAGVSLSLLAALATSFVLYLLVRRVTGSAGQALFTLVLFQVSPISPLLQLAYAESLQWLLIVSILYLLVLRRFGTMIPLVVVLAFTRPGALAMALAFLLYGVWRWRARRREAFPVAERWWLFAATATAGIAGLAWVVIAGVVTGVPTAYLDTELAWRSAYIGYVELVPFTPWLYGLAWWLPFWGVPAESAVWLGPLIFAGLIALLIGYLYLPATRRAGIEIRVWVLSYSLYLLAVFFPQSSTFRLLGPLFPGLVPLAAPKNWFYRVGIVLVALALQVVWVGWCWAVDGSDWTPP